MNGMVTVRNWERVNFQKSLDVQAIKCMGVEKVGPVEMFVVVANNFGALGSMHVGVRVIILFRVVFIVYTSEGIIVEVHTKIFELGELYGVSIVEYFIE